MPIGSPMPLWTKRARSDGSDDATRGGTVASIGAEHIGVAGGAEPGHENLLDRHTGLDQLLLDGGPTIEEPASRSWCNPVTPPRWVSGVERRVLEKPAPNLRVGEARLLEPFANLRPDFVTTRADRRTDRHEHVGGPAGIGTPERLDRNGWNPKQHPSPPSMGGRDGTRH